MELLVSVRSADEVEPALAGGADILDAKEPNRGSLGAVAPDTLSEIIARVPAERALSVAMGDMTSPEEVVAAVSSLGLPARPAPVFLKLGFAGVRSQELVRSMIAEAVATAASQPARARIIAVAYGDANRSASLSPSLILALAHQAGATGVLLDTHVKDGVSLLGWNSPDDLADWVSRARQAGLVTALAGGLDLADVEAVCVARPDVLGFRGAACVGGRHGRVAVDRVRALRERLPAGASAYLRFIV